MGKMMSYETLLEENPAIKGAVMFLGYRKNFRLNSEWVNIMEGYTMYCYLDDVVMELVWENPRARKTPHVFFLQESMVDEIMSSMPMGIMVKQMDRNKFGLIPEEINEWMDRTRCLEMEEEVK